MQQQFTSKLSDRLTTLPLFRGDDCHIRSHSNIWKGNRLCSWPWNEFNKVGEVTTEIKRASSQTATAKNFDWSNKVEIPEILESFEAVDVDIGFTLDEAVEKLHTSDNVQKKELIGLSAVATAAYSRPRANFSANTLAYLGDSVFELYARRHFLHPPLRLDTYFNKVTGVVCCESQNELLCYLLDSNLLSNSEKDIVKWGRNATTGPRKAKDRAGSLIYGGATALETLVGYLHLKDQKRLDQLMEILGFVGNGSDLPTLTKIQK